MIKELKITSHRIASSTYYKTASLHHLSLKVICYCLESLPNDKGVGLIKKIEIVKGMTNGLYWVNLFRSVSRHRKRLQLQPVYELHLFYEDKLVCNAYQADRLAKNHDLFLIFIPRYYVAVVIYHSHASCLHIKVSGCRSCVLQNMENPTNPLPFLYPFLSHFYTQEVPFSRGHHSCDWFIYVHQINFQFSLHVVR